MKLKTQSLTAKLTALLSQQRNYSKLKGKHDIVLDPYLAPFSSLTSSNYAKDFLHIKDYANQGYPQKTKVVVFVLDTAGEVTHKDLKPVANQYGKDFTGEGVADGNGHGTACASCYIGPQNGCADISNTVVVPVKVLRNNGSGSYSNVLRGINYAFDAWKNYYPGSVGIISMSLGGGGTYAPIENAIKQVTQSGMFVFASAGNSGYSTTVDRVGFPAKAKEAIAVGAVDKSGKIASFSSAGPEVEYTGPGASVLVAWKNDTYITANGTSFSMPYSAAAFSWLIAVHDLTPQNAKPYFSKFATDLSTSGWDRGTGYGAPMLNRYKDETPEATEPGPTPEPDPKPEPPKEVERESRDLIYTYSGKWSITWKNNGEAVSHRITITELNILHRSTSGAETAHDKIEAAIAWFFKNRGLILSVSRDEMTTEDLNRAFTFTNELVMKRPYLEIFTAINKDYQDAAYWTKRFLEVVLKTQKGLDIKVLQTIAQDEVKRSIVIL